MLSLGYTWLLARTVARCEAEGLEVNLGGLHEYRPGRPSLACDLMEPLRTPAVDRWVVLVCTVVYTVRIMCMQLLEGYVYRALLIDIADSTRQQQLLEFLERRFGAGSGIAARRGL